MITGNNPYTQQAHAQETMNQYNNPQMHAQMQQQMALQQQIQQNQLMIEQQKQQ